MNRVCLFRPPDVTVCFIHQMSLFDDADESFIKMLSKHVRLVIFRRGDYIVRKHDMGSDVFFIHLGT